MNAPKMTTKITDAEWDAHYSTAAAANEAQEFAARYGKTAAEAHGETIRRSAVYSGDEYAAYMAALK